ncbi:hypothetical protein C8Q72DRAFT_414982 [Fomitopsis betulina]|nr:hypothetical protein C8Q72DRAFT_414982 [Fomitopsis betulina]
MHSVQSTVDDNASPYSRAKTYDRAMGALLLGVNFQCITYGILVGMTFIYYRRSEQDPRWLRFSVLCAWLLCTFCVAISLHGIYWFTILHYNDPSALQKTPWSVSLVSLFTSFVMLFVRLGFLHRVYKYYIAKLQPSLTLVAGMLLVVLLSIAELGGAAAATGESIMLRKLSPSDMRTLRGIFVAMFSVDVAADVLLTALLCTSLHKSRSNILRMYGFLNLLVVYTIRTGFIACGFALATLICFLITPRSLLYSPFYAQTGNLYLISLLAILNYRQSSARCIEQPSDKFDNSTLDQCGTTSRSDAYSPLSEDRRMSTPLKATA